MATLAAHMGGPVSMVEAASIGGACTANIVGAVTLANAPHLAAVHMHLAEALREI